MKLNATIIFFLIILCQESVFSATLFVQEEQKNNEQQIMLEEIKLNCLSFKPNLITKFLWKEGPTRGLLYKKCLEQSLDDESFVKYSEKMINDSNIGDLIIDLEKSQTRLTIYNLIESLKNYLEDKEISNEKLKIIKKVVIGFKEHYKIKKELLDSEIKIIRKKENKNNKKTMELVKIITDNEEELDINIEYSIKYIDFILKDRIAYFKSHNKFLPEIYVHPQHFKGLIASKYECDFLKLNFNNDWDKTKKELQINCLKN